MSIRRNKTYLQEKERRNKDKTKIPLMYCIRNCTHEYILTVLSTFLCSVHQSLSMSTPILLFSYYVFMERTQMTINMRKHYICNSKPVVTSFLFTISLCIQHFHYYELYASCQFILLYYGYLKTA